MHFFALDMQSAIQSTGTSNRTLLSFSKAKARIVFGGLQEPHRERLSLLSEQSLPQSMKRERDISLRMFQMVKLCPTITEIEIRSEIVKLYHNGKRERGLAMEKQGLILG